MTDSLSINPTEVTALVGQGLDTAAKHVVPWFYANMPEYYLKTHALPEQVEHLQALISGQVTTERRTITLRSECDKCITYLSPGSDPGELLAALQAHSESDMDTVRIYTSKDELLRLFTILLAPQERLAPDDMAVQSGVSELLTKKLIPADAREECVQLLSGAPKDYFDRFDPLRAARHCALARKIKGSEDVCVELDTIHHSESRITVSMTCPPRRTFILQAVKTLQRHGVNIRRAYADFFDLPACDGVAFLSFYVHVADRALAANSAAWRAVREEMPLCKWNVPHDLASFADNLGWSRRRAMLLQAACEYAHQFLVSSNLWAYTSDNIVRQVRKHPDAAEACVAWFEARFDPAPDSGQSDRETLAGERHAVLQDCIDHLEDEAARRIFVCMERFVAHTLRTNYYLPDMYGLSFRIDPAFLQDPAIPEAAATYTKDEPPYGFFFFHGPYAQGFHVRYRDMSRGGMRVVTTRSQEHFELESNRLFNEVTNLAYAQQIKNKDIPEGGSKGVILLGPHGDITLAVKSVFNSLLDLILADPDNPENHTLPGVVDYLRKEEIIYLGPDERIESKHIEFAVARARERHYRYPDAFMSSKPGAGINHKEYGVTSLGVMVFTEEVLHSLGIEPTRDPFTVKITGGPRGDVAGNVMRILMRDYGTNARIVAVSDGHGAAHDPKGLDHGELERLIAQGLSITDFDPAKLSSGSGSTGAPSEDDPFAAPFVQLADTKQGARLRNELHNRARADIFIPSGGRPDTINASNWRDFLDENGRPSARAMIEGANIFITPEARDRLQEKGCIIVHGSSANKTGVICSSYEILGGLVMNEEEFLAIKPDYVAQVLDILRVRARDEARLLLREYKASGARKPLTQISLELSNEINRAMDTFYNLLVEEEPDFDSGYYNHLRDQFLDYCPKVLVETYRDRIFTRIPMRHQYALVSAYIASRIVYAEGVGWLDRMSSIRDVESVIRAYLHQEKTLAGYLDTLGSCSLKDKEEIARILDAAGRSLLTWEALKLR